MKKLKPFHFMILIFINLAIFFSHGVVVAEVDYLGEFCFSMDSDVEGTARKILQLGVLSLGNQHYPAHGRMTVEGRAGLIPVHGAAVKDGDDIVITLSGSDHGKGSDSFRIHAIIGETRGRFTTIEHLAVQETDSTWSTITHFYVYGDITVIPCQ